MRMFMSVVWQDLHNILQVQLACKLISGKFDINAYILK